MQEAIIVLGFTTLIGIVGTFCKNLLTKIDGISASLQGIKETQVKQGVEIDTLKEHVKGLRLKHTH